MCILSCSFVACAHCFSPCSAHKNDPIHKLVGGVKSYYTFELLLETIKEGEEFRAYDENELVVKFRVVDVAEEVVANAVGPQKDIRLLPTVSVQEMKHKLAEVSTSRFSCVVVHHCEM